MAINLFGFTIARNRPEQEPGANDVIAPDSYDGSFHLDSGSIYGGFMSSYADFTGSAKTEEEFITNLLEGEEEEIKNFHNTLPFMQNKNMNNKSIYLESFDEIKKQNDSKTQSHKWYG